MFEQEFEKGHYFDSHTQVHLFGILMHSNFQIRTLKCLPVQLAKSRCEWLRKVTFSHLFSSPSSSLLFVLRRLTQSVLMPSYLRLVCNKLVLLPRPILANVTVKVRVKKKNISSSFPSFVSVQFLMYLRLFQSLPWNFVCMYKRRWARNCLRNWIGKIYIPIKQAPLYCLPFLIHGLPSNLYIWKSRKATLGLIIHEYGRPLNFIPFNCC